MYVRTVKVPSSNGTVNEYLRVVEAYRENGKVKQRIIADLGRRDMLSALLPNLRRILEGTPRLEGESETDVDILETFGWGPLLVVRKLFDELGLWDLFDRLLGKRTLVPWADRAFVLIASRLIHPSSEHGLAGWRRITSVIERADALYLGGASGVECACITNSWTAGIARWTDCLGPRKTSRRRCMDGCGTCSA